VSTLLCELCCCEELLGVLGSVCLCCDYVTVSYVAVRS